MAFPDAIKSGFQTTSSFKAGYRDLPSGTGSCWYLSAGLLLSCLKAFLFAMSGGGFIGAAFRGEAAFQSNLNFHRACHIVSGMRKVASGHWKCFDPATSKSAQFHTALQ